jgi:hypothetical protein
MAKALVDRARTTCKSNYHILKQHKGNYMKKTILALTAVTMAAVATPALAGTLQGEVRFGDVRGGAAPDNTEYKVEYWAPATSFANYGVELQTKQKSATGVVDSKVSVKAGPALPDVLGFHTAAYGEFGRQLKQGYNGEFWGAGVKVGRQLYGPISASVGYRHREGFKGGIGLNEERLNGGLALDIGSGNAIGVQYYRTSGTTRNDQIGVGVTHTF